MSFSASPLALELALPWSVNKAQEKSFKKLVMKGVIPVIILLLIIPWLPVVEIERVPIVKKPAPPVSIELAKFEKPKPPKAKPIIAKEYKLISPLYSGARNKETTPKSLPKKPVTYKNNNNQKINIK